jgi:hypothetical protein
LEDGWISDKSIAEQLGISRERVGSIIHEDLDMRKVTKGVLFLHDNAPDHRTLATQKKLANLGFNLMKIGPVEAKLFHADGRTDMTKLIVAICNFANPPKNIALPNFIYS